MRGFCVGADGGRLHCSLPVARLNNAGTMNKISPSCHSDKKGLTSDARRRPNEGSVHLGTKKREKRNLVHIVRTVTNPSSGICPVGEARGARAVHVARGAFVPGVCAGVLPPRGLLERRAALLM